jgi:polyphosphate kinase
MFPVPDKQLQQQLWDILNIYWIDNKKSWRLLPSGQYIRLKPGEGEAPFCAQDYFLNQSHKNKRRNQHK